MGENLTLQADIVRFSWLKVHFLRSLTRQNISLVKICFSFWNYF